MGCQGQHNLLVPVLRARGPRRSRDRPEWPQVEEDGPNQDVHRTVLPAQVAQPSRGPRRSRDRPEWPQVEEDGPNQDVHRTVLPAQVAQPSRIPARRVMGALLGPVESRQEAVLLELDQAGQYAASAHDREGRQVGVRHQCPHCRYDHWRPVLPRRRGTGQCR